MATRLEKIESEKENLLKGINYIGALCERAERDVGLLEHELLVLRQEINKYFQLRDGETELEHLIYLNNMKEDSKQDSLKSLAEVE